MLFEEYLSRLIQLTEDRALVMSRQSEAWSCFTQAASVEYCAEFLTTLGVDHFRSRDYPNF